MKRPGSRRRLRVWHVSNSFHYAGTERAMALWARSLDRSIFDVRAYSRDQDGPRRLELQKAGIMAKVLGPDLEAWKAAFKAGVPDLLHVHRHGEEDAGWTALCALARSMGVRVIAETNVFGERRRSEGPASPDVMGYMSTFCLWRYARWPAALPPDHWGPHAVFYNPLVLEDFPAKGFAPAERRKARRDLGIPEDAIVAGRLGRPDPNKWSTWLLPALAEAVRRDGRLYLAFMEAPPGVAEEARRLGIDGRCCFLDASAKEADVRRFYSAIDILAHSSRVGESFGYTLAEAMAWGIPVVVDSTPWADNAQIELVGHEEQGLVAGRPAAYTAALLRLAADPVLRARLSQGSRAAADRFEVGALTRSLEGVYARALLAQGVEHPALQRLAHRNTSPVEDWVQGFGALYQSRLGRYENASPALDGAWALYSALRLYGRGWASKTLKRPFVKLRAALRG